MYDTVITDMSLLGETEDSVQEQSSVSCLLRSHDVPATTASTSPIRQSPLVYIYYFFYFIYFWKYLNKKRRKKKRNSFGLTFHTYCVLQ